MSRYFPRVVLPLAAALITSLCVWRLMVPRNPPAAAPPPIGRRPAPAFVLPNQQSQRVSLEAFLHRHPIVLAFFDERVGAADDPGLQALSRNLDRLEQAGAIVLGVSTALPHHNRQSVGPDFAIPLLTDVSPLRSSSVIRTWGRLEQVPDGTASVQPGVFYIDRAGLVAWQDGYPQPVDDIEALLDRL